MIPPQNARKTLVAVKEAVLTTCNNWDNNLLKRHKASDLTDPLSLGKGDLCPTPSMQNLVKPIFKKYTGCLILHSGHCLEFWNQI